MSQTPKADRVLCGGSVLPMEGAAVRAEAVAIAGDRILATGSREDMLGLAGDGTDVTDYGDACILPGLIEPHTHPDLCADCYAMVDVSGFRHADVGGVENALREAAAAASPGKWIFAFGLDPMLTGNLGTWDRARLDALAPDNPTAVMIQSMHTLFVNSAALEAAGVTDATPDPAGGGRFARDGSGRLTGKCVEAPSMLPFLRFVDRSPGATLEGIAAQYRRYARAGLTTIGTAGLFTPASMIDVFRNLGERADVPIRNVAYLRHHQIDQTSYRPGDGSDTFRVQGVKLWYDGSPYSGTMLLDEPYLDSRLCCCTLGIAAGTTGHANFAPEEMRELVVRLRRDGWQVLTHAQGDRGTREALDLYEYALAEGIGTDHRWRLEHCALISREDLVRAARLGVTPSFHVNHIYYYGDELRDSILGARRAGRLMPVGSAVAAGHRVSLHADSPMYPPEPFRLVRTAVTRRTRRGEPIAAQEALTVEQALRAVTIDAAWQLFAEDRIGSLAPGKLADVTIVDRNPLDVPADEIDRVAVIGTWLGGRAVPV